MEQRNRYKQQPLEEKIAHIEAMIATTEKTRNNYIDCGRKDKAKSMDNVLIGMRAELSEAKDALKEQDADIMTKLVVALMQVDLAYKCFMEFEEAYRAAGRSALPIMQLAQEIVKNAHDMVALVDEIKWPAFASHYAQMTDELDDEFDQFVKQLAVDKVIKECKFI